MQIARDGGPRTLLITTGLVVTGSEGGEVSNDDMRDVRRYLTAMGHVALVAQLMPANVTKENAKDRMGFIMGSQ